MGLQSNFSQGSLNPWFYSVTYNRDIKSNLQLPYSTPFIEQKLSFTVPFHGITSAC